MRASILVTSLLTLRYRFTTTPKELLRSGELFLNQNNITYIYVSTFYWNVLRIVVHSLFHQIFQKLAMVHVIQIIPYSFELTMFCFNRVYIFNTKVFIKWCRLQIWNYI